MVKTKILLVEDDKSLREIYGVRLYSEGYDIISAGDGEEALAMAIKERPTLIISDVMMPKISGFDMLDILRSTTETKSIKVIMMTALSSEDQRARGEALGADRYLVKSQVGIEDVVRTVHEVLGDAPVSGITTPVAAAPAPSVPSTLPAPAVPTQAAALPQPTAPFSTNRPANLGDRVIHPLESSEPSKDFGALINAELGNTPQPIVNPAPAPEAVPQAPAPGLEPLTPPVPTASFSQSTDSTQLAPDTQPPVYAPDPAPLAAAPEAAPIAADQPTPIVEPAESTDYSTSTLPPDAPSMGEPASVAIESPTPTGMSFEETPYAANPIVATEPPAMPAGGQPNAADEPPIVIPPRPTPGV